ncbi:intermembrane phospholipid transport protein YdbH family protein [Gallaecimonas xiamenensis]|uniref:Dicarboxylate transport protein YdbH/DctA n=1 Tax=Gallaecimonas xiamenensis 3-C-1 TaxID=745411 RepID=K2JPE2_9GAMM|nr:YdbH domain-containing protein [Gallaecimonas xiamenensis]EKE72339.1 dicarboxylate transport protein YdbH/DctA [Gallaecimonas xiamenensis 3-C-1]
MGKWLGGLALLLLLAPPLLLAWFWPQGLSISGLGWFRADSLRYQLDACPLVQAKDLHLDGLVPLAIRVGDLAVAQCPSQGGEVTLPALPTGTLHLSTLHYPPLPPLAVTLASQQGRVTAELRHQQSQLTLHWQPSGDFQFAGQLSDWAPTQGLVQLQGQGRFTGSLESLHVKASSPALGYGGQQLALSAQGQLQGQHWQLSAHSLAPLTWQSLGATWQLAAQGELDKATLAATLDGDISSPLGPLHLKAQANGLERLDWQLTGERLGASGNLDADALTLSQGELNYQGASLSLAKAAVLPLAAQGQAPVELSGSYQQLQFTLKGQALWGQQLALDAKATLSGGYQGQQLAGVLPFRISQDWLQLAPFRLKVSGPYGQGELSSAQPQGFALAEPALALGLAWQYQGRQLTGDISLAKDAEGLLGGISAQSSPLLDKGGRLTVNGSYRLSPEPMLLAGSALSLEQGLWQQNLVQPSRVSLATPLTFSAGPHGTLSLSGQGLVRATGRLPPWQGSLTLAGDNGQWQLAVPAWQASAGGPFTQAKGGWQGSLAARLTLNNALSQGLPVALDGGRAELDGSWRWPAPRFKGTLALHQAQGFWGASRFEGLEGQGQLAYGPDWSGTGQLRLALVDIGTPVTGASAQLAYGQGQLHLSGGKAALLGGSLFAPQLTWPSSALQAVSLSGIDLGQVAALQAKPVVSLGGELAGTIPLRLEESGLSVSGARLHNQGPVTVEVLDVDSVASLKASNQGVQVALDALGHLAVDSLQADFDMDIDGQAQLKVLIEGRNPRQDDLPVRLHYAHQENLRQLLRSLRIGEEVVEKVEQQVKQQRGKP